MTSAIQLCLAFLSVTALVFGESHEMVERMYMSRKTGTDLSPEATGFIFRKDNDGPASYVKLGAGVVNKHLDTYPSEYYTYPVVPEVFSKPPIPLAFAKLARVHQEQAPRAEKIIIAPIVEKSQEDSSESKEENQESHGILYDQNSDEDDDYPSRLDGYKGRSFGDHDNYNGYEDDTGFGANGYSGFEGHGYGDGFGSHDDFDGHRFNEHDGFDGKSGYDNHRGKYAYGVNHGIGDDHSYGGGSSYNSDGYSGYGEKGSKGYKEHHCFDNGQAGEHGAEGHKGHYSKGAGEKGAKFDESEEYGSDYSSGKTYKGEDFGDKKGHSKGEKTTGFHNVYHKDEYKKDKEIYDKSDASGHFNKHGGEGAHHQVAHGGHEKGGHHESAQKHDEFGKKGFNEAGHEYSTGSGHDGKSGADSYQNHHTDFSNKGGSSHGREHAYEGKH